MIVRVRLALGPPPQKRKGKNKHLALMAGWLLTPLSVAALFLACWRLAADMNWTGQFAISSGLFSHWQVWITVSAVLELLSILLDRYGRGDREAIP